MTLTHGAMHRRTAVKFALAATVALGTSSVPLLARAAPCGPQELVEPGAGAWRTGSLLAGTDLHPPPRDSQGELHQVRALLGQVDPAGRDLIAYWAAGALPYRWNELATDIAFQRCLRHPQPGCLSTHPGLSEQGHPGRDGGDAGRVRLYPTSPEPPGFRHDTAGGRCRVVRRTRPNRTG